MFATAALLHAETRLPVEMIRARGTLLNPLYGDLSAYCQQINRPTLRDPSVFESLGVFVFPDLSVRHEGMYIIEFTLWEVEDGQVVFRGTHRSNTFRVYTAKEFPGMAESTPINELLKSHGIRVRVARRPQGRRTQPFLRDPSAMDAHNRVSQYHDYNAMDTGEPVNHFVEYDDSRESTPDSDSEDENMVYSLLHIIDCQEDAMDIVPSGVPPGGILPIPMHSAPVMHYNNFGERPAYAHQPQSPFSGPRHSISHRNLADYLQTFLSLILSTSRRPIMRFQGSLSPCLECICRVQAAINLCPGGLTPFKRVSMCRIRNVATAVNSGAKRFSLLQITRLAIRVIKMEVVGELVLCDTLEYRVIALAGEFFQ